ncbi:MFS transporter [Curtobacterium oceanosedimentum]|uniref:MFS transporter n=1 Tax=Curtobacterium oceanosedimentum TaxID=465820 RepID=UPI001CE0AE77|nr:MFS transporter [Curtobacterium oceanosedimentum]MCA5924294.1 MFS transporter [Curtobacterium oceanosedimentum]
MQSLEPISDTSTPLGRDFTRFWVAQGASAVGGQVSELAVPLLAVVVLHASAAEVGVLNAARWLPFLLLALPLGVLIDRRRRLPILVVSDLARAALTVVVVVVAFSGALTLPVLVVLVGLLGAFTVAFEVSYQSFLPTVVGRRQLERANGRLQATAATAEVGGPGLGGLLVQVLSAPWALAVHALTYVVSAVALLGIRAPEPRPASTGRSALRDLGEGLRFVGRDRYLVSLVGFAGIYNLFAQWVVVLFTVHAVRQLGLDAGLLGLVLSLGAVGAVAGAAAAPSSVRRFGAGPVLVACAAAECIALAVLPVVDPSWSTPVTVIAVIAVFAVNGAGTSLSSVVALTLRQLRSPDHVLGRVNATMRWLSYGVVAIGAGLGGLVGELLGTRTGIALGCAGTLLTVVWVVASPLRTVRDPAGLATHGAADQ